jgi:hypothetical protein
MVESGQFERLDALETLEYGAGGTAGSRREFCRGRFAMLLPYQIQIGVY